MAKTLKQMEDAFVTPKMKAGLKEEWGDEYAANVEELYQDLVSTGIWVKGDMAATLNRHAMMPDLEQMEMDLDISLGQKMLLMGDWGDEYVAKIKRLHQDMVIDRHLIVKGDIIASLNLCPGD